VGAGGGSVAWLDEGGALRVGPGSAGADPGPACYGRGGPPTVTDAHVVAGRLAPDSLLGGGLELDTGAAVRALAGVSPSARGARDVIAVANASMERALRVVSVERGFDPRDFTLVAFGGAGPLHACDLAEMLSVRRVLVPRFPGILSAIGMALADLTRDASAPLIAMLTPEAETDVQIRVANAVRALTERLRSELGAAAEIEPAVDMRYAGQGYELTVAWPGDITAAVSAFRDAHARRYGHASFDRTVELTVVRARARVRRETPSLPRLPEGPADARGALTGTRKVLFDVEATAKVYAREKLIAGNEIRGPAIVEQLDSTTLIPPAWRGTTDAAGNLILEGARRA
jgi:N-methylhydantoinase A